jgi:hypothetical protein
LARLAISSLTPVGWRRKIQLFEEERRLLMRKRTSVGAVAASVALALVLADPGAAAFTDFIADTDESRFDSGVDNQGWWGTRKNYDRNDNYAVDRLNGETFRDFFTFDLSGVPGGTTVCGAALEIRRGVGFGERRETLEFFDVSTDAVTLNRNRGKSAAIFADLGTGTSYGRFRVRTRGDKDDVLEFVLNDAAEADAAAAAGGFFSVGGALQSITGKDGLFGFTSHRGRQRLTLDFC